MNSLTVGTTTSGKSYGMVGRLIKQAEEGETAIVVADPHLGALVWSVLCHLIALGLSPRILFDSLANLGRVLGLKFLEPSKARNPLARKAENDERIDAFIGLLCRRRGTAGLASNPQLEEWVQYACHLFVEQEPECSLALLPYCYVPKSRELHQLIDRCRNDEIARVFRNVDSGKIRRGLYSPAARLLKGVCTSPAFQVRCGASFDLAKFLGNPLSPGILLIEGGSLGNVSFDAMRTMLGSVIHKVIQYVRNRKVPVPRIHLVIDEASNADLIGMYECRALAETQKMGLDISILTQTLDFGGSYVRDALLQNCMRHEWYYCGNSALATLGASDLGDPEKKAELMHLSRGERIVKVHRNIYREKVGALDDLWCFPQLTEKKTEAALRQIQQRPEYQDAKLVTSECEDEYESTPAPQNNLPVDSSPLDRLDTDE